MSSFIGDGHLDHRPQIIWPDDNNEEEWPTKIDDYNLLVLLGHGTFGRVFRSYCKQNGKECAIKCIPKRTCSTTNFDKILSEVHIHIRLNHPRILQLFTVLEDAKAVYLVMEICHGGSLSQLLNDETRRKKIENIPVDNRTNPTLSYQVISAIIVQICDALDYLHRNSIVHRDLNSNNILLVRHFNAKHIDHHGCEIQIKIADFGLAIDQKPPVKQPLDDGLFGTTICGTPGFISPEVWTRQQKASYKSDIFSLGSILFACITGYTPKGEVDISTFLPMIANLMGQLWNPEPEKRPKLDQIREHIFVSGRIDSNRLFPIEKQTKSLKMSLDKHGNATMNYVKENLRIKIVPNGSRVSILTKNNQTIEYGFYELPEKYWKHYLYVSKFVNLVKSKTSKITVHCSDWFRIRKTPANEDVIVKCVLMANGDFEITKYNEILDEHCKFLLHHQVKNHQHDDGREFRLYSQLYGKVLHLEKELARISQCLGQNLFPITVGIDHKLLDNPKQYGGSNDNYHHMMTDENNSFLNSEIIRSIPIQGIGHATHFSNGSIKVNFEDGADLCMDRENRIFYLQGNVLQKFHRDETLPPVVVDKIARLPQVIEQLRESENKIE